MSKLRFVFIFPIVITAALVLGPLATAYADCVGGAGDDTLVCDEDVSWVAGDDLTNQDGGNDDITVTDEADIDGWVSGDGLQENSDGGTANGGDDTMVVNGTVNPNEEWGGAVAGDDIWCEDNCPAEGDGGDDDITIGEGAEINVDVVGDSIGHGDGGDDDITVNGEVNGGVIGDGLLVGSGGDDDIIVNGTITGEDPNWCGPEGSEGACGDWAIVGDQAAGPGGNDTITINPDGTVTGIIYGDGVYGEGDPDGGDDVFNISGTLIGADLMSCEGPCEFLVAIMGDSAPGDGGDDTFNITGNVEGEIWGDGLDNEGSEGGDDVFNISGTVDGWVMGDNSRGDGGDDTFNISGDSVFGDVWGDHNWGEGSSGGDDVFNISGTIAVSETWQGGSLHGDMPGEFEPDGYTGGDDTVTLMDGASFAAEDHIIDGNGHVEGDTLVFAFTTTDPGEVTLWEAAFAAITNNLDWQQGDDGDAPTLTFRGELYRWQNFENVRDLFQLILGDGPDEGGGPSFDCGPDPYLEQRQFNAACEPYTGDPMESVCHGMMYSEAVAAGLFSAP